MAKHFTKEDIQKSNEDKKSSTSPLVTEMQVKTTKRFSLYNYYNREKKNKPTTTENKC